jgi:hypothetical protein
MQAEEQDMPVEFWGTIGAAITSFFLSKETSALVIGLIVLFAGRSFISRITNDGPFKDIAPALAGLVFLAPLIIVFSVTAALPKEAVTGLLGTIVGYFFGAVGKKQT